MIDEQYWKHRLGRDFMNRKEVELYFQILKAGSLRVMDSNGTGIKNRKKICSLTVYPIKDIIEFFEDKTTDI